MAIFEKINPRKSISLLLFYVAMALSIVYFDLFQAIENSSKKIAKVENIELVVQQRPSFNNSNYEFSQHQFIAEKDLELKQKGNYLFTKRLFHDNRNLAHQFKELEKQQLLAIFYSHLQFTSTISHQKMEEEGNKHLA